MPKFNYESATGEHYKREVQYSLFFNSVSLLVLGFLTANTNSSPYDAKVQIGDTTDEVRRALADLAFVAQEFTVFIRYTK